MLRLRGLRRKAPVVIALLMLVGCGRETVPNDWYLASAPDKESQRLQIVTEFSGQASGCNRYEAYELDEGADEVSISVLLSRARSIQDCTEELVLHRVEVELNGPLGNRVLTGCGRPSCEDIGPPSG